MAFGFGVLRLAASDFWRLTPSELVAASRAHLDPTALVSPLQRGDLVGLMQRFPDTK